MFQSNNACEEEDILNVAIVLSIAEFPTPLAPKDRACLLTRNSPICVSSYLFQEVCCHFCWEAFLMFAKHNLLP